MRHPGRGDGLERVTIEHVAAKAGVSTATVSRFLTRPDQVSDRLAERVRSAVGTLGYVPNAAARALSSLRSGTIGVVVANLVEHAETVAAASARLAGAGLAVYIAADGSGDGAARQLVDRDVEGVVFVATRPAPSIEAMLGQRGIPWVACAGESGLAVDARAAAQFVGARLTELGHRAIGLVGASRSPFLEALRGSAGPLREVDCDGYALPDVLSGWLHAPDPPTALVCADDTLAAAVLKACHALRIAVPDQMSLVGWGDRAFAAWLSPSLATVRLPLAAIGEAAAERLLAVRAGGSPGVVSALSAKLVVRRSLGPAPASVFHVKR
jgi:LacI family transcriptional regulator